MLHNCRIHIIYRLIIKVMTKTILIVEDDHAIRDMVKMLLEHHEYNVIEAKDYLDALKLSQSSEFHLVFLVA